MKNAFEIELKSWMKNRLSPYCLESCKSSCCNCTEKECIFVDRGYEHLFKTYKLNGKKVKFSNKILKKNKAYLYNDRFGNWYFIGGPCPNYDVQNKKCMIHNQHPVCALYPLEKIDGEYGLVVSCPLSKMDVNCEPLKSLINLCKKQGIKLNR